MSEEISCDRRRFFGSAAMSIAAQLAMFRSADAHSSKVNPIVEGELSSLDSGVEAFSFTFG